MRCSSCESLLDAFIDGALEPARATAVVAHLASCRSCEALHRRLRVVDGLLLTARAPDLHHDFTVAVMQFVRTLPAPQPVRKTLLPLAVFYLVAAWITAAALLLARPRIPIGANAAAGAAGNLLHAIAQGAHALWPVAPVAVPAVVGVLILDALLFAGLVVFYRRVRPRLAAYLTVPVEAR